MKRLRFSLTGIVSILTERTVFKVLLLVYGLAILFTFKEYGITPDEEAHIHYGNSVINWYTSLFQERRILSWTNTWLYGGFYDTISYLVVQISPLESYDTRHLFNALFGLLGVVAAYQLGCALGGRWAGCLAAVFLILTPRYYGHAFNNHKDIPFAVCYLWAIYGLIRGLGRWPRLPVSWMGWIGLAIGLTMGIRVGGMVLFLYLGVFYGLRSWQIAQGSDKWFRQGVIQCATIFGISYAVMLLFWPWAQLHPLWHPFEALTVFSKFPILFINYFEGVYLKSTDLPWYYASKWILLTLPEFVLIGLLVGASCLIVSYRKRAELNMRVLQIALLVFSALFPLVYIAATDAALYAAMRHVLFVIPPLVVLGALGVDETVKRLSNRRLRYGFSGVIGGAMLWTLSQMLILHPNEYLYFNHLFAGGLKTASERYETDYFDNSYRQGVRWVEAYASTSERHLRLSAGTSAINFHLNPSKFEYVGVPTQADLYLITTQHEGHRAVPGEVLHQVEADGVPILYVIRPDETFRDEPLFSKIRNPYRGLNLGDLYQKTGRVVEAIQAYQEVIQHDPQFAKPYVKIANLYFESERFDHALAWYNQALERMPFDPVVLTQIGDCLVKLKRADEAISSYRQALFLRPYYLKALHNLAAVHFTEGRAEEVLKPIRTALWVWPESISGQQLLGWALIELGNLEEAEKVYRALVEQTPEDPMAYYNLGTLLQKQGQTETSIQAFQEAINLDPENALRYVDLGRMLADVGQKAQAIQAYRQSLRLNPDQPSVLRALQTLESR